MINLTVTFTPTWMALVAFLAGASLVGLFWRRDRREVNRRLGSLQAHVREIILDARDNSLVLNIVNRVEAGRGGEGVIRDFELLDGLVRAALSACGDQAHGLWQVWQKYRERVFKKNG